jgi:ATP-dependent Clp protease ATP-binding subunit ClpC
MFERYLENARRVVFFARLEASEVGSPSIETEHLLLGLLREDQSLIDRFLTREMVESIREQIKSRTPIRPKVPTNVDMPISNPSKNVLTFAMQEADRASDKYIGPQHLLLGLLHVEKSFAAQLLVERGLTLPQVRAELARNPLPPQGPWS